MLAIRDALDELTLKKDGVDGKAIYLYGEGWNFGEVANNALFEQATQGQLGGTGIGTFTDRLRDAVHGGSPVDASSKFSSRASAPGSAPTPTACRSTARPSEALADLAHKTDLVKLGLAGNLRDYSFTRSDGTVKAGDELDYNGSPAGYADQPDEIITYVDAHDNETLYDLSVLKLPADTPMADRVRMNTLSLATTTLRRRPRRSGTRAPSSCAPSRSTATATTRATGSTASTGPDRSRPSGRACRAPPTTATTGTITAPLLADPANKPGAVRHRRGRGIRSRSAAGARRGGPAAPRICRAHRAEGLVPEQRDGCRARRHRDAHRRPGRRGRRPEAQGCARRVQRLARRRRRRRSQRSRAGSSRWRRRWRRAPTRSSRRRRGMPRAGR